ncbi:hypothetical protein A6411_10775 [Prescottella equi]|uniref:hypothetical protein n=1 Tax=Rhodococcus hoagii TaxID=43767 RepID=UPI0009C128CD|nr:hypothetical protein [Prescottella equi]OQQ32281.1 hypothetical protein A6411_10775 [Prescottella equi]
MSDIFGMAAFQKVDGTRFAANAINPMRDFSNAVAEVVESPGFQEAFNRVAVAMKQVRHE